MNDLIGILIPLLMSGADIQTIFRHLAGANGAASYDGLRDMISRRNTSFSQQNPLWPTKDLISRNASAFVDTIGVNPYTGFGQGLTNLVGSMYSFAPDVVGGLIGLPNPGSFYQQIANGSSGISVASGRGLPQLFNPYSARDAYNNAVNLARTVHDMSVTEGHGFNVDFTHGLNMSEVGTVAQRLLSSEIPYTRYTKNKDGSVTKTRLDLSKDENGDYISQNDANEFSDNLKRLGGKFNETVSMLSKITGSVKDAIDLMDSLGGGNFLSGTENDALAVARKARNMAANIRVTSAMAGIDPREAYSNMSAMQQGLVSKYGVNPMLAAASGFDSMMLDPAYRGTMAYQMWAAQNPNASERDRTMVMAGARARVMQYAGTSGEALAAMVSANMDRFSEDDLKAIETAYRMGRPNDIKGMVRERMGAQSFDDYMSDPAAIMGFMLSGDKDLQGRLRGAALEGNLRLAEVEGGRRMLRNDLADTDREIAEITGNSRYGGKERREASAEALRNLAIKNDMSEEFAATRNVQQLRAYLLDHGVDGRLVERIENTAAIDRQIEEIDSLKMTDDEEKAAKERLKKEIGDSGVYSDTTEIFASIDKAGADLNAIYDQYRKDAGKKVDRSILGGKLSAAHAENLKKRLKGHQAYWAVENTPEEMKRAVDALAGSISMKNSSGLLGMVSSEEFLSDKKTDQDALEEFDKLALESADKGLASLGSGSIEGIRKEAWESVVRDKLFSGGIGDLQETVKGEDGKAVRNKKYDKFTSNVAEWIRKSVEDGASIDEASKRVLAELYEDEEVKELVGDKGREEIKRLSQDKNSLFGRKDIASAEQTAISRSTAQSITDASKGMFDALKSDDSKAGDKFYEAAEKLAKAGVLDQDAFSKIDRKTLGTQEGRKAALEGMSPDAYNKRLDAIRAAVGTGDAQTAMLANIATMAERKGLSLDVDALKSMDLNLTDEQLGNFVSYMDRLSSGRNQDAVYNAINLESGSFGREEIERSRKMIGDLRDAMKSVGIESGELDKYDKAGAEDKKKIRDEWAKKLGDATREVEVDEGGKKVKKTVKVFEDSEYASKLAASLVEKGKIGDVDAKKILFGSSVDLGKLDDKGLASVTKEANQKDSVSYDILESVSKIADAVAKFSKDPLHVLVTGYSNGAENNMTEATRRGVDQGTFGN